MVMVFIAVAEQLILLTVYIMLSVPAVTPVTMPDGLTEAFALLLLHVPPVTTSVNVMAEPTQTVAEPEILPAFGDGFIVTIFVATAVPHVLVTV